ncbi:polyketide cyclase [Marinomonas sp. TI.3.20]|uniref:polyketide cyclase n=1 Tax=Marinomonas sp. TI.3.20 TaxID=3121296 RepID=UPI00311F81AB
MSKKGSSHPKALYQLRKITRISALVILAAVVIGFFLPTDYRVERSIIINKPHDAVVKALLGGDSLSDWMFVSGGKVDLRQGDYQQGDKATISYDDSKAQGELFFTAVTTNSIAFDVKPKPDVDVVHNTIYISGDNKSTNVDWEISGKLRTGFLSPYLAFFANKIAGRNFETSLQRLKEKVELTQ